MLYKVLAFFVAAVLSVNAFAVGRSVGDAVPVLPLLDSTGSDNAITAYPRIVAGASEPDLRNADLVIEVVARGADFGNVLLRIESPLEFNWTFKSLDVFHQNSFVDFPIHANSNPLPASLPALIRVHVTAVELGAGSVADVEYQIDSLLISDNHWNIVYSSTLPGTNAEPALEADPASSAIAQLNSASINVTEPNVTPNEQVPSQPRPAAPGWTESCPSCSAPASDSSGPQWTACRPRILLYTVVSCISVMSTRTIRGWIRPGV